MEQWNGWMMSGEKSCTKGGATRAASLDVLCGFVGKGESGSSDKIVQEVRHI
jgi:hypothetical protein